MQSAPSMTRTPEEHMAGLLAVWEQLATSKPFPMPWGPSATWVGAWYDAALVDFIDKDTGKAYRPFTAEDIPFDRAQLLQRQRDHMARVDYRAIRDKARAESGGGFKPPGHLGGTKVTAKKK